MIRILLVLYVTLCSTSAHAEMPEDMVASYMAAMNSYDFNRAVGYFAESDCVQFKRMIVPLLQIEAASGKPELTTLLFGREADLQQIGAMHPCSFVARTISSLSAAPTAMNMRLTPTSKILGGVRESDDLIHYVVRSTAKVRGIDVSNMEIVTARLEAGIWHIQMSEKIKGMSSIISRALQQQASAAQNSAPNQTR